MTALILLSTAAGTVAYCSGYLHGRFFASAAALLAASIFPVGALTGNYQLAALSTIVGTAAYVAILSMAYDAGLTCGRLFAAPIALLAAAVPIIAMH